MKNNLLFDATLLNIYELHWLVYSITNNKKKEKIWNREDGIEKRRLIKKDTLNYTVLGTSGFNVIRMLTFTTKDIANKEKLNNIY